MHPEYRRKIHRAIEKAIAKNAARPAVKWIHDHSYSLYDYSDASIRSLIERSDFLDEQMWRRGYVQDFNTKTRGRKTGYRHDPEAAQRLIALMQAKANASYFTFLGFLIEKEQGQIEKSNADPLAAEDGIGVLFWPDRVEFWDTEQNRTEQPLRIFKHFSVRATSGEGGTEVVLYADGMGGVIRGFWDRDLEGQQTGEQRGLAHTLRALGIPER
jgi:hypothetical protein